MGKNNCFKLEMDTILMESSWSSSVDEEEMVKVESSIIAESTSYSTKCSIKKFKEWLRKREVNFHSITVGE